jgi:gluconokinase
MEHDQRLRGGGNVPTPSIVIMGMSCAGKSLLGSTLAGRLGWDFIEGDDHHPRSNLEKMARGEPLTEEDRLREWLPRLARIQADRLARGKPSVLVFSGLRRRHRDIIAGGSGTLRFFLEIPQDVAEQRAAARQGHFLPASLIPNQVSTFEPICPSEGIMVLDGTTDPEHLLQTIIRRLVIMYGNLKHDGSHN